MDANESGIEEKFIQNGVLLKQANASYIAALNSEGILTFGQCIKTNLHVFEWKPETCDITDSESLESGWSLVDPISRQPSPQQPQQPASIACMPVRATSEEPPATTGATTKAKLSIRVFLRELKGLETYRDELRFYNHDHTVHSVYLFRQTSTSVLLQLLERFRCVRKSTHRKNFYRCIDDPDQDKLQKSFSELNIADIRARPRPRPYMDMLSKWANVQQILPIHRPVSQSAIPGELRLSNLNASVEADAANRQSSADQQQAHPAAVNGEKEQTESKKLAPRPAVHRGLPLDAGTWEDVKCPNGSISDPERVKEIIFRGGIKQDIRAEVWKYLLGLDVWEHTAQQRDERRAHKTQEYFQMKFQWLTMTATQEHNFTGYRERKCQIEKDVKRTDRTYEFFAGDDNPNLAKLQDILMTYVMYNFDLGYVQGMSDLLAPILSLVQNEAESFWCFVGFMHKVFANFDIDQKGMKQQLEHLRVLLSFVNERLFNYMRENQSENMYFCFRWLLVWFKREFSNADIMQLWEVLWTGLPCPNFHLFVCVAILDQEMDVFIDGQFSFTEILKHVNELSGNLNLAAVLEQAESIYLQLKQTLEASPKESYHELRKIIGEQLSSSDGSGTTGNTDEDEDDDDSCMSIVNERSPEEKEILQRKLDEACDLSLSYMFF
ncbi:TBC1 domain family member 15 [Anopheles stephensi]|uniref:TBC1 domain family member 15 n=1 Tax=Anopheles stephensi TaxID=30069 RepID=A0A182YGW3_ANOST|nr:TBC1 domain family member 15 [Anopheles stephensi]